MITNLSSTQSDFQHKLSKLLAWESVSNKEVVNTVDNIIANIKAKGDAAKRCLHLRGELLPIPVAQ
jgi:histidinol dehydrogenase